MASYKWTKWTDDVIEKFKEMYPTESWEVLLEEFPFKKSSLISKASELNISRANCRYASYSAEEDEIIRNAYDAGLNDMEISSLLQNRSDKSVNSRRCALGLTKPQSWSTEEDDILKALYNTMPAQEIADILGNRSRNAVVTHAITLGLKGYKPYHEYTNDEYEFIKRNYQIMSDQEIADILGHPRASVKNHRNKIGYHRTDRTKTKYDDTSIYVRRHNKEWKMKSIRQCGFKCVLSDGRFSDIHHLVSMNTILKDTYDKLGIDGEVFDINVLCQKDRDDFLNAYYEEQSKHPLGVCLDHNIHMHFHMEYGYGDNTPEQFYEFVERFYPSRRQMIS